MFKKLLAGVLAFGIASTAFAEINPAMNSSVSETGEKVTLIVEVEGTPVLASKAAEGISAAYAGNTAVEEHAKELQSGHETVIRNICDNISDDIVTGFTYTTIFNGFSITVDKAYIDNIKNVSGVKDVYISGTYQLEEPRLESSSGMIGAPHMYDVGYDGEGEVVAVIDAGCQTDHEMFSSVPKNPKYSKDDMKAVLGSLTLNAGDQITTVYKSEKIPFAYNYYNNTGDVYLKNQFHGTHVSAIACGKDGKLTDGTTFSGVAPEAQLMFFNVASAGGSFSDAAVFAALNDVVALGVDVVNISFGAPYFDERIANGYSAAIDTARAAGIFLSCAAGNDGRGYDGAVPNVGDVEYSTCGTPVSYSAATGVGSIEDISNTYPVYKLELRDGTEFELFRNHGDSAFATVFSEGQYLEYEYAGYGLEEDFTNIDLTGKIALVSRGKEQFTNMSDRAQARGAIGLVIINTSEEHTQTVEVSLPCALAKKSIGDWLKDEVSDKAFTLLGMAGAKETYASAGKISDFSSWGVGSTLELKPELSAPGGQIYSAVTDGQYGIASGTSMAAPHVSGATVLFNGFYKTNPYIDRYNNLTGADRVWLIENIFMGSADIVSQESGVLYSPRVQGAGVLNLESAIKSQVLLVGDGNGKAKISLGDGLDNTIDISFDVYNIGEGDVSFDKIEVSVMTDGHDGKGNVADTVSLSITDETLTDEVTIASGEGATVSGVVTLDNSELLANNEVFQNGFYIDGFVTLSDSQNSHIDVSIPFMGFYGDFMSAPVFDSTIYDDGGSTIINTDTPDISGTRLIAGFEGSGEITLGQNPFDETILDSKYIAFNPDETEYVALYMQNKRFTQRLTVYLLDSDMKSITGLRGSNGFAKYWNLGFKLGENFYSGISDGNYFLKVEADIDADGTAEDSFVLPVTYDREKPDIITAKYDSTEKTVAVTAKDNHYLSVIYVAVPNVVGQMQIATEAVNNTDDVNADGTVTKVFDVSGIADIDSVEIGCMDYALNESSLPLSLYTHEIGARVWEDIRTQNITSMTIDIINNTESGITANFIMAFYDIDGRFMAACRRDTTIGVGDNNINFSLVKDTRAATLAKVLILESVADITPHTECKQISIEK